MLHTSAWQTRQGQQSHQSIIDPHPSGLRCGRRCLHVGHDRRVLWRFGSNAGERSPGLS